jgi:Bacterial Ig domain
LHRSGAVLTLLVLLSSGMANGATFSVVTMDGPGVGFNDTTPVTSVGGNAATTLGEARLNVLKEAGRLWGQQINSTVPIVIEARFTAQDCNATSGTLASTGPKFFYANAPEFPLPNVFYPAALAFAIAGRNFNGNNDIQTEINSNVDGSAGCLHGRTFYLGFNHTSGGNIDLLNVMLHELGHGLGFVSLADSTGASSIDVNNNKLAIFDQFVFSETPAPGKFWRAMTNAERAASETSSGNLVWKSPSFNFNRLTKLNQGLSTGGNLRLYAPTTFSNGSSVSHWDIVASPNLLMEPIINSNANGFTDLTTCVMRDMGWPGAHCADTKLALPQAINATEDTPIQFTLQGVDFFPNSLLTYTVTSPPTIGSLSSPATLTSSTGVSYTYTPNPNANGQDSLTFQVSDGTDTSLPATILINVAAVDDAPVANAQSLSATAGVSVAITLTATDVDSATLTYIASSPSHGTLTGTAPTLVYTPEAGFSGTDSFTFVATDGSLNSNAATVTFTVTGPVSANGGATSSVSNTGGGGGSFDWLALASLLTLSLGQLRTNLKSTDF